MNETLTYALNLMIGGGLTTRPTDNGRAVLAIRAAEASGDRARGVSMVLAARAAHRDWVTRTQRQWQQKTRRAGRANHHDSVALREKYVRCGR